MGCETKVDGICVPSQAPVPVTLICSCFEFVNLFMKIYVVLSYYLSSLYCIGYCQYLILPWNLGRVVLGRDFRGATVADPEIGTLGVLDIMQKNKNNIYAFSHACFSLGFAGFYAQ